MKNFNQSKTPGAKVLVIAPHGDDEVLGCGGTIAKYQKLGAEIHLVVVTKPYTPPWSKKFVENRPREVAKAAEILKIAKVHFLNLPTVKLDTIPQKQLNDLIKTIINDVQPQAVYLPSGTDVNRDHRLIFEAGLVATRPTPDSGIKKIFCYEVLSETEWGGYRSRPFLPNVYVDINKELPIKLRAMRAYQTELKPFPHPRSIKGIEILAQKRGMESGMKAAEAFELIRVIK